MKGHKMLDVKQAIAIAVRYVTELLGGEPIADVRLEEVELSEDGAVWNVTLSLLREPRFSQGNVASAMLQVIAPKLERLYKVLAVDSNTGAVKSMKIRHLP